VVWLWIYWFAALALVYSIIGYCGLVLALQRVRAPYVAISPERPLLFSFLIAAHNERACIAEKIANTLAQAAGPHAVEVVVVSDGSTDGTAEVARAAAEARVTVVETAGRTGKAGAINLGLTHCRGEVVVFSDANAILADGSLAAIARHFGDPAIGGVCGRISVRAARDGAIGEAEGLFWRYDQAIKAAEARLGGTVSAQGSVYAVRRALTAPLTPGCTDDFEMSVRAVRAGRRLTFEPDAWTVEPVTEKLGREMGRRIRSTERGWRALMLYRELMNPLRHGWYAWQLFSHKLVRRLNPVFLVLLLIANLFLLESGWFYLATGVAQIAFYLLAAAGMLWPPVRRFKPAGLASFFVFAHLAMLVGIVRYYRGHRSVTWTPVREAE
jgi:cellulose synthase/poly-beta-1,6-N-acetylglucosamine synthase-like glycosyltransferase